jgi:hypothetical protein
MTEAGAGEQRTQVDPYADWEILTQHKVIERLDEVVKSVGATNKEAARLAVIAIGNAVWLTRDDWPEVIDRANDLLGELEGGLSRRWA